MRSGLNEAIDLVKALLVKEGGEDTDLGLPIRRVLAVSGDAVFELAVVFASALKAWSYEVQSEPLLLLESVLEMDNSYNDGSDPIDSQFETSTATARVGSALVLTGVGGQMIEVTLVRMVNPASPRYEGSSPEDRIVAIQLRFKNVGSVVYDDCPHNCVELIDNRGQQLATNYCEIVDGPLMPSSVRLFPGDTRLGYMTWEFFSPDTQPTRLQATLDSGTGPETGIWDLASNA